MGRAKDGMMQRQESEMLMAQNLLGLEFLKECEYHEILYDGWLGNLSSDDGLEEVWKQKENTDFANLSKKEFFDLAQSAWEDNCADECPICAKNRYS